MAQLNASRRNALADRVFGLPKQRKYQMPDKSHAADAKGRATQQYKRGRLSLAQKEQIDAKANRKLRS